MNPHELKGLQSRLQRLSEERIAAIKEESAARSKVAQINSQLFNLRKELEQKTVTAKELIVSEHAMLRYLERIRGINLDDVKKKILGCEKVTNCHDGQFPVGETHAIKVKNNTVITVLAR